MARPKSEDKGVRMSIYLRESQLKWLDEQVAKAGTTRTKFIEEHVFPVELQCTELRQGHYNKKN